MNENRKLKKNRMNNENLMNKIKILTEKLNENKSRNDSEKKELENKLNDIMNENRRLKRNKFNNVDLMNKNKILKEKLNKTEYMIKQLQTEKEKYLNEIDKHKQINDIQINNINNKSKITYLKYLIEKKMIKEAKYLKKYFFRYKDISYNLKIIEGGDKNYKKFLDVVSTGIKSNTIYKQMEEDKIKQEEKKRKEKEDEIIRKKRLLKELVNKKKKDNDIILHLNFTKFYYKGLINEIKNQKKANINPEPKKDDNNPNPVEDLPKKEEEFKKEEEPKKEEESKKEEIHLTEEERHKINEINRNRRKKLIKLLEDEKKKKLQLKRIYFKRFHFKLFLFAKNPKNKDEVNLDEYLDEHLESRKTIEERNKESELQLQKEREELINKKKQILQKVIYKMNRESIIILKNNIEKWNLRTKLICLKDIKEKDEKENKGKSKSKSKKSKKKKKEKKDE